MKERQKARPFPTPADPKKQTQQETDAQNSWWQSFNNDYYARFGPRALAIVQQYGAKGVDVRMIEQQAGWGYIAADLVLKLRAFASRLDEDGNLKD